MEWKDQALLQLCGNYSWEYKYNTEKELNAYLKYD